MIAENLLSWDKLELARILADRYADAEDLLEALPEIDKVETFEVHLLKEFVEKNWMLILPCLDSEDLYWWLNEKEEEERYQQYLEEYERWKDEQLMEEMEYYEELDNLHYLEFIETMEMFRGTDFAGLWGYPAKHIKS